MKWYIRAICFIGGANINILKKCSNDRNKFIAVGIGVLNTAILSMLTMGYAIYSVINDDNSSLITILLILVFSVFWGFVIFGIDWGLISTIHKRKSYNLKSSLVLFSTTLFRLTVATVISFTVSKPLEVLVFKEYLPVAKREMQLDYQNKLNLNEIAKEEKAKQLLNNAENESIVWNRVKNEVFNNDPIVKRLIQEKKILISNFDNLHSKYKIENSKSSSRKFSAQGSINSIQKTINSIISGRVKDSIPEQDQEQIVSLRNSMNPFISIVKFERKEINTRNRELKILNLNIKKKQGEIDTRIGKIDIENKKITAQLIDKKERLNTEKDSIVSKANIVYNKNKDISNVFEHNNLINNIIAIGYLEKWNNDLDAKIGEKEIAKKVTFVSWLLMILILIIDIAPIVIKLLIKRGCYEEEKEKIEDIHQLKIQADIITFAKYYPEKSIKFAKYKEKIEELDAIKNANINFYKILEKLSSDSFKKMRKFRSNFSKNITNKKYTDEFQNKMENQLKSSINKFLSIFKDFIDNIKP